MNNIYIHCCDKNNFILPLTIYLYKKFIPDLEEINILGYNKPNLEDWKNINFVSLNKVDNIKNWGSDLYNFFSSIDNEIIFFSLEDCLPIENFNQECYNEVIKYMKSNNIGNCILSQTVYYDSTDFKPPGKKFEGKNHFFYERNKNDFYNISCQPGLWKREYLCRILKNIKTPWDFEIEGTKKSYRYSEINLASCEKPESKITSVFPCSYRGALSSSWGNYINLQGFSLELIKEIIEKKLIDSKLITIGNPCEKILFDEKLHNKEFFKKYHSNGRDNLFFLKYFT